MTSLGHPCRQVAENALSAIRAQMVNTKKRLHSLCHRLPPIQIQHLNPQHRVGEAREAPVYDQLADYVKSALAISTHAYACPGSAACSKTNSLIPVGTPSGMTRRGRNPIGVRKVMISSAFAYS